MAIPKIAAPEETYRVTPRRPQVIWSGKRIRRAAEPVPAQTLEIVRPARTEAVARDTAAQSLWPGQLGAPQNRLIWTNDNLVALTSLLAGDAEHAPLAGKVDLIYIDPPFAVQSNFSFNVEIEDGVADEKLPTLIEQLAYEDTWKDGLDSYLSMMRDRLELLKALLAPTGSIYVHCDWHAGHYLKVLMDEVFGYENLRNDIRWVRSLPHNDPTQYGRSSDAILYYVNSDVRTFVPQYIPQKEESVQAHYKADENGRLFRLASLLAPGGRGPRYVYKGFDRNWRFTEDKMLALETERRIYYRDGQMPSRIYYLDESLGSQVQDVWTDISPLNPMSTERVNFPTQKPIALLQRIIAASSNPGDLVLDAFAGSGTTAVAAETIQDETGKPAPRRWIAIDCGKFAIHTTRKRMIHADASPFTVESIGFYSRADTWQSLLAKRPSARVYRDALVEIYGGEPVEGFTYLHGHKGTHWVHVGPLDAPIGEAQLADILKEAASTDLRAVDVLSADIPVDWNPNQLEYQHGVVVHPKIIPQAAVEAVRERLRRKRRKDPDVEPAQDIHFFSPPDVEVGFVPQPGAVTIKLLRLTVDLDDCLSTQDERKRAQIKAAIKDWTALVDYWAVDWDWHDGKPFENQWQFFRSRKQKDFINLAAHTYAERGEKRVAVKVTDIFGNDGLKVVRVTV